MTFQPGATVYTQAFGSRPENIEVPHYDVRAPSTSDILYPVGKFWVWPGNALYYLSSLSSSAGITTATWVQLSLGSGDVLSVSGTTNQIIPATPQTGSVALSLANPLTTPGPATIQGNLTISGAGTGLITTPTVVTAGATPQTANGRVFVVTFSGVSIASGASQTFTISNTAITGASTDVSLTWYGATAGSALSIQSVTPSASSLAIVMTNGTSATMVTSVANITFVGIVLN